MKPKLVDAGVLVALFSDDDLLHETASQLFKKHKPPLNTTWPVITEAAWMLRKFPDAVSELLGLVIHDDLKVAVLDQESAKRMSQVMLQYRSLKLQLADASLVWLAEQLDTTDILTFDRRDFAVVRLSDGRCFDINPES